ncbi:MAG: HTH domain-containing protein [Thermoflexibacter sp.]|jgi:predicted DNA-binding transcriptional regulator YafY|nr:HTH domain-containing protein [Thermoflexibacter sp.]
MSIAKLSKLITIHEQISQKKTGTPSALAQRLDISERSLYYYIKELRKMGAPIRYCSAVESYVYQKSWQFEVLSYLWKNRK